MVSYSRKLASRSEARASDLKSYPGLWWKKIKLHHYEGNENEYSPRTWSIGRPCRGHSVSPTYTFTRAVDGRMLFFQLIFFACSLLHRQTVRGVGADF